MRVGTVCFAIQRGLGYLAKAFYDHGVVTDVAVINHGRIHTNMHWYPDAPCITRRPFLNDDVRRVIEQADVMLFFETPFDWDIIPYCQEYGVKTVLMTMYECTPAQLPYEPDMYLCPSLLDMEFFPNNSVYVPVPVSYPWQQRTKVHTYVHNAGYVGLRGRHGTLELLQAMQYVTSPLRLVVRAQTTELNNIVAKVPGIRDDPRVEITVGDLPYEEVWKTGDVFVDPEKFNGLSLPLQEARAAGLLVMATNRFPVNSWLPTAPLIPVTGYRRARTQGRFMEFDEAIVEPRQIAATMDAWYGRDISDYSLQGRQWAETISWPVLKPQYLTVLDPNYVPTNSSVSSEVL